MKLTTWRSAPLGLGPCQASVAPLLPVATTVVSEHSGEQFPKYTVGLGCALLAVAAERRKGWQSNRTRRARRCARLSGPEDQNEGTSTPAYLPCLEQWRAGPPTKLAVPVDANSKLPIGSLEDDYSNQILDRRIPIRPLALVSLPAMSIPCVGHAGQMHLLGSDKDIVRLAALQYSLQEHNGLVCCVPEIEKAITLPFGGILVQVRSISCMGAGEAFADVRGISSLRLVNRTPVRQLDGFVEILVQELLEWGPKEKRYAAGALENDLKELDDLFEDCASLQKVSGFQAAGDFGSKPLSERADAVLEMQEDVRPLDVCSASGDVKAERADEVLTACHPAVRRASAVSHAIVACLSEPMRLKFMCDPCSVSTRITAAKEFLIKVQQLLRAKMAFRRAFEDDDGEK